MSLRWIIALALVIFQVASGCAFPQKEKTWTVMSWNVQNLFDGIDDGTEYPEFDPGGEDWSERLYLRRLDRTAEVIRNSLSGAADLLILQELEKAEILNDLTRGPLGNMGYKWRLGIPGYSITRCGVLSRYPIHSVEVADCGFYNSRPLRPVLSFVVDAPGGAVRVFALHWKSPNNGRAITEGARFKEALIVRNLVEPLLRQNQLAKILIIGDLNTPGDGKIQPSALAPWPPDPDNPQAALFRSERREWVGLHGENIVFFDPNPNPALGAPGTYWYQNNWDRPDRALLSRGLINGSGLILELCRTGASRIMGDSWGRPKRWYSNKEEGYSDHLPLVLEFRVRGE